MRYIYIFDASINSHPLILQSPSPSPSPSPSLSLQTCQIIQSASIRPFCLFIFNLHAWCNPSCCQSVLRKYPSTPPPPSKRNLVCKQFAKAKHETVDERQDEIYGGAAEESVDCWRLVEDYWVVLLGQFVLVRLGLGLVLVFIRGFVWSVWSVRRGGHCSRCCNCW